MHDRQAASLDSSPASDGGESGSSVSSTRSECLEGSWVRSRSSRHWLGRFRSELLPPSRYF